MRAIMITIGFAILGLSVCGLWNILMGQEPFLQVFTATGVGGLVFILLGALCPE